MDPSKQIWKAVSADEVTIAANKIQDLYQSSVKKSNQCTAPFPDTEDRRAQRNAGIEIGRQLGLADALDYITPILRRVWTVRGADLATEHDTTSFQVGPTFALGSAFFAIFRVGAAFYQPKTPPQARGWAIDELWIFGEPVTDIDREILEALLPAAAVSGVPVHCIPAL